LLSGERNLTWLEWLDGWTGQPKREGGKETIMIDAEMLLECFAPP